MSYYHKYLLVGILILLYYSHIKKDFDSIVWCLFVVAAIFIVLGIE